MSHVIWLTSYVQIMVFWAVTPCHLVWCNQRFEGTWRHIMVKVARKGE